MLDIIKNNPFRILGVGINAPLREIVANRGRISAFSKVGKQCVFPLDMTALLGPVDRSAESVQQADSALTIDSDKLRYAQFWLMKGDEEMIWNTVLKDLNDGKPNEALLTLRDVNAVWSLQNQVVLNLIRGERGDATLAFSRLYTSYAGKFLDSIGLPSADKSALLENYFDEVSAGAGDINPAEFTGSDYPAEWNEVAREYIARPFMKQLEDAIAVVKNSKDSTPAERLKAGRQLARTAKQLLMKLRRILSTKDLKLVNIADRAGNEVLQCAIDYCNALDSQAAYKAALPVAKEARMIVMGPMRKQRCDENITTIENNISQAPPDEVADEIRRLQELLNRFQSEPEDIDKVGTMITNARPLLNAIRSKVGDQNPSYVFWASATVNTALNVIISVVNELQKKAGEAPAGTSLARGFLSRYIDAVNKSYGYLNSMETIGMSPECRQRFNTNFNTLKELYNAVNVTTSGGSSQSSSSNEGGRDWGGCITQLIIYIAIIVLINMCK